MAGTSRDPLAGLLADPPLTCVATDFDGTLAPIVDDPASVRPLPEAGPVLVSLATRFGRVAVISGRPARFIVEALGLAGGAPPNLSVVGLYGMESLEADGRVRPSPEAEKWRDTVARAADEAGAALPEAARVERKGLTVTLHWRTAPETSAAVEAFARDAAARLGLAVHPGKMSAELRPPLHVDKGTALAGLLDGMRAAAFAGDDVGDLPAFATLDRLRSAGSDVLKVAVTGAESPPDLVDAADVTVDGPEGVLDLWRQLARRAGEGSSGRR